MPKLELHWCFNCHDRWQFSRNLRCPGCGSVEDYIQFGLVPIPHRKEAVQQLCKIAADCRRIGIEPSLILRGLALIINHDYPAWRDEVPAV